MVMGELVQETQLLVIGGGPGGYAAAFRAADLGMDVTLVDAGARLGGECLFRGCIPSKTLLHLAELMYDARRAGAMGIDFGAPRIDLAALRKWKGTVIDGLAGGLNNLCDRRGIQLVKGRAVLAGPRKARIFESEVGHIKFGHAILASGSRSQAFPGMEFKPGGRIMDAVGALALADIPGSLLVVGGGYVGLELGMVYAALGSRVTLVEQTKSILPGVDSDLAAPLLKRLGDTFDALYFESRVAEIKENSDTAQITLNRPSEIRELTFDRVLVAIGREPNSRGMGLEKSGVRRDEQGAVLVDEQQRTAVERIFAVGDVTGGMMLAHKAAREGKVAAEVIAGEPSAFDVRAIPAVVYTDPQIAWCGVTETQARAENREIRVERFPWRYSGRAATMGATEGMTKLIIDPLTQRIIGMGIVGRHTEGMIAEGVLAIEMGALARDLADSIHPHPTLSETGSEAAEIFLGSATHYIKGSR